MRILITTLTMMFISSVAIAKDTIYKCGDSYWKVSDNFPETGKKTLYTRINGVWIFNCSSIMYDSIRCEIKDNIKFVILDEVTKELGIAKGDYLHRFRCEVIN